MKFIRPTSAFTKFAVEPGLRDREKRFAKNDESAKIKEQNNVLKTLKS